MVFVLAGMVGWLYWQQTRLFQNMNSVLLAIGDITRAMEPAPAPEPEVPAPVPVPAPVVATEEEDDRASVEEAATEVVDGPPAYRPEQNLARGPALHVLKPFIAPYLREPMAQRFLSLQKQADKTP